MRLGKKNWTEEEKSQRIKIEQENRLNWEKEANGKKERKEKRIEQIKKQTGNGLEWKKEWSGNIHCESGNMA